jgi:hypothetical protein
MNISFHRPRHNNARIKPGQESPSSTLSNEAPSEYLILHVSPHDIYWASRTGLHKPMLLSLQRATGTLWQLYPSGLALEIMAPYRACSLPAEVHLDCQQWQHLLEQGKAEWPVELKVTEEREGYSLFQRRAVLI